MDDLDGAFAKKMGVPKALVADPERHASELARLRVQEAAVKRNGRKGDALVDEATRAAGFQVTFRLAHLVKAIVTSLPLYACVALKMQGEHAVLAADALARGGIARGARERRGAT